MFFIHETTEIKASCESSVWLSVRPDILNAKIKKAKYSATE